MRVLVVDLERRGWRGGQEQVLLLMRGLRARGHHAELVAMRGSLLATRASAERIPVHQVSPGARRFGAFLHVRRLVRGERFDIVLVNESHALFASFFARAHRHAALVIARRVAFPVRRDWFHLIRYRAAARIIAVSEAVREDLLTARLDSARIEIVSDGVELTPPISPEEREAARARWGLAPGEKVFSFPAFFAGEKGHALLLEAFEIVRKKEPNARLLLAGDGPLRAPLEQKARETGLGDAVIFAGFVGDVRPVYAASDAFVFPALVEGAGSAMLAAMAAGVPVVALASGGVPEIVEDDRNGLLVREAKPEPLAEGMLRLLNDPEMAQRLAKAGRSLVTARFSADRMVEDTLAVFERLTHRAESKAEHVLA